MNGQFSDGRYAIFLQPGDYDDLNIDVGYYVSVYGLGFSPSDVNLKTLQAQNGSENPNTGSLDNFWRSAENVKVSPNDGKMMWAVS